LEISQTSSDIHPQNKKYHLCVYLLDHNLSFEFGSPTRERSQDGAKIEDFKYLSKGKYISGTYLVSITSLLKDEKRLSIGDEVGTMQFRVQGK
jgi:hypothetical protein